MKVTVDVDCTPLEARAFLGLPDLSPLHEQYIQTMLKTMESAGSAEQVQAMMRSFAPMGDAGMKLFQQMFELGAGAMTGGSKKA